MAIPRAPLIAAFLKFAGGLRFRQLFFITGGLFVFDMLMPDLIPFVDELILGLLTLLFASWKKKESDQTPQADQRVIEGEVVRKNDRSP